MRELGVTRIADFIPRFAGRPSRDAAGLLNTPICGRSHRRSALPVGAQPGRAAQDRLQLWLYDCINCDKCVPVCPNDANFVYETRPRPSSTTTSTLLPGWHPPRARRSVARGEGASTGQLRRCLQRMRQLRHFLPGRRRPARRKPRFFGSLETYSRHAGDNGFLSIGTAWPPSMAGSRASRTLLTRSRRTARASNTRRGGRNPLERRPGAELDAEERAPGAHARHACLISSSSCWRNPSATRAAFILPTSRAFRRLSIPGTSVIATVMTEIKQALFKGSDWITTEEWTNEELDVMLDVSADLKRKFKGRIPHRYLPTRPSS
jgi:ferredoxin